MKTIAEITRNLAQAIGSMSYTRHQFGIIMTDGVVQLREDADAYWLVDAIASYFHKHKEEFQVWKLEVDTEKKSAVLTMKEDSNRPELVRQEIEYTDFPLDSIEFYLQLGSIDGTTPNYILMLTSEY